MATHRFDAFEFDPRSGEIRRGDRVARLEPQPAKLLAVLLEHAGEVVSREELKRRIWPAGTFVDFDRGLSYCIAQIRTALGDTAGAPRYLETLPKRGYRFRLEAPAGAPAPGTDLGGPVGRRRLPRRWLAVAVGAFALALGSVALRDRPSVARPTIAVARFDAQGAGESALAERLTDAVTIRLASASTRWSVIGNAALLGLPRPERNLERIRGELGADFVVLGQVWRVDDGVEILVHWIRLRDQKHLWAERLRGEGRGMEDRVAEALLRAVSRDLGAGSPP